MKIAILTLSLHHNFGGILQAFALQTVLEQLGHEVVVINKPMGQYSLPIWKRPLAIGKRLILKYIFQKRDTIIFQEREINRRELFINNNTNKFINKYIHQYLLKKDFPKRKVKDWDAVVVGSDQVWRPYYFKMCYTKYSDAFLDFAKKWDIKRIAYAASFGTEVLEMTDKERSESANLIKLFNAVSVREESGVKLCKNYLNTNAIHVLDPTLLLNSKDYLSLIDCNIFLKKHPNSLMCYILDKSTEIAKLINNISIKTSLTKNETNSPIEDMTKSTTERVQIPVEQWIAGFVDAKLVITDSFHACVFSIIFRRPFFVIGNKKRGLTRICSLLSVLGLEDRILEIDKANQFESVICNKIDWEPVYEKMNRWKIISYNYLKQNL